MTLHTLPVLLLLLLMMMMNNTIVIREGLVRDGDSDPPRYQEKRNIEYISTGTRNTYGLDTIASRRSFWPKEREGFRGLGPRGTQQERIHTTAQRARAIRCVRHQPSRGVLYVYSGICMVRRRRE